MMDNIPNLRLEVLINYVLIKKIPQSGIQISHYPLSLIPLNTIP